MSHGTRGSALVLLAAAVAVGCGGAKGTKRAAGPDDGDDDDDCEPGRCLGDVSAAVEQHRPAARACYEEGHQRFPTLQGRLIINFEIDASGAVVDASQSAQGDQIEDETVVACVVDVVRGITFAPSALGKSTRAFHRYDFNPP